MSSSKAELLYKMCMRCIISTHGSASTGTLPFGADSADATPLGQSCGSVATPEAPYGFFYTRQKLRTGASLTSAKSEDRPKLLYFEWNDIIEIRLHVSPSPSCRNPPAPTDISSLRVALRRKVAASCILRHNRYNKSIKN